MEKLKIVFLHHEKELQVRCVIVWHLPRIGETVIISRVPYAVFAIEHNYDSGEVKVILE